jgi:hypothetical protein
MADADLLVHAHVPKCGGTSVWMWLAAAHPGGHGNFYPGILGYVLEEPRMRALHVDDPRLRSMSTHDLRTFPAISCGRTMRYFSFVRDPIAHFFSYYRFMRAGFDGLDGVEWARAFPPNFRTASSRDYAAWALASPYDVPYRSGYQTDFFAGVVWRKLTGRGPAINAPFPEWIGPDWDEYRAERLGLAKLALRSFAAVGVLERLHDGLAVVRERSRAWGFDLPPVSEVPHENVTEEPGDDLAWLVEDDAVGSPLLQSLADDRALYVFAESLLDAALAEQR